MSRRAIKLAVRDFLRSPAASGGLGLSSAECDVVPEGRPPARMGKRFVGIDHGGTRPTAMDVGLDETHTVLCVVTMRINEPMDRVGPDLIDRATAGLDDLCDALAIAVHEDQWTGAITQIANTTYLSASDQTEGTFFELLEFAGAGPDGLVGPEWFWGAGSGPRDFCGLVRTVTFGGARRLRQLH